jgi:hypothetical protein
VGLDPVSELERLVDALDAAKIPYGVCGGLALAMHGHPRATMDIDLLVRADELAATLEVARTVGFDVPARKMTFGLVAGTAREVQRVSKLDPDGSLLALDLIVVNAELESVWASRIVLAAGDRRLSVVSRDGLITMKRIAGRPQDVADLAKLEGLDDET